MFSKLIAVLTDICEVHADILQLGENKHQAIIGGDYKQLEKDVALERGLRRRIDELEQQRQRAVQDLLEQKNIAVGNKMMDMLPYCDEKLAAKVSCLHDKLKTVVQRIQIQDEHNEAALKQLIEMLTVRINMFSNATVDTAYVADGGEQVAQAKCLDFKA